MKYDIALKNALVVTGDGAKNCTVCVNGETIAALLSPDQPAQATLEEDWSGKIILPGAIDTHGHVSGREDFHYGTMSAARGGITTLIEMPTSGSMGFLFTPDNLKQRLESIARDAHTDVALWGGAKPGDYRYLEALFAGGCVGFKAFMASAGDFGMYDNYELLRLMERVRDLGGFVGVHAEDEAICKGLSDELKAKGGAEFHNASRPEIAEQIAVSAAILIARETGCRLYICHVSSPKALDIIVAGRKAGMQITAETCPHYLTLTEADVVRTGAFGRCNPPLRSKVSQERLWDALVDGAVNMVGSDHSDYPADIKDVDFWSAPGGFPGLDLMLSSLFDEGVRNRGLGYEHLADITATSAAKQFGLYPKKGVIAVGSDADFAIIDPSRRWTYHCEDGFYKNKSSKYPYEGKVFLSDVVATYVRGKKVYESGEILAPKGYGKYLAGHL